MSKKYFVLILGLFLAAGFLFLNTDAAQAKTFTWTGGGDGKTWTDLGNWASVDGYPGATTTDAVTIAPVASTTVYATTSLGFGLSSLTLDGNANGNGPTLIIGNGATINASTTVLVVGTSTLQLSDFNKGGVYGSGTLILGNGADGSIPLSLGAFATFTAATGTVTYTAGWNGAAPGNTIKIATTTYYNLNLTPTTTPQGALMIFANMPPYGSGMSTSTNVTVNNNAILGIGGLAVLGVLTINTGGVVDGSGGYLLFTGSGTPFVKNNGVFNANGAMVDYEGTSATNIATATYSGLIIDKAATKTLLGNTTATSTVWIGFGATLDLNGKTFTATGVAWTNNGTVLNSTAGSKIVHASTSQFTNSSGNAKSSFNGSVGDNVYLTVTDSSLNYDASTPDTLTASVVVTATSDTSSQKTVTLVETGNKTGVFLGNAGMLAAISGNPSGLISCFGSLTLSSTFTDSPDTADTSTAIATGNCAAGGGGGGGGGGAVAVVAVITPTVVTPTVTAPAVTTPTLESVSTKVAAVVAKIVALPASPTASDLASIQAEIAVILLELQTVQAAAQPTPQGVALGFNFVRPLALGARSDDIMNLQKALKTDSSVYPEGLVTGYFGPMTLRAVQKFQEKYGIAKKGDSGYGNFGPKTRAKFNELYGGKK